MSAGRINLQTKKKCQEALCRYITDTLFYVDRVQGFLKSISEWMDARTAEVSKMKDLKTSYSKPEKQQRELEAVLMETQVGLENLDDFLDAVEKLTVTSLPVFTEVNPVLDPPEGVKLEHVQAVIIAARMICPLLLEFKREAKAFFLPKLQNVEVLADMLDRYIQTTHRICENLEISHLSLRMPTHIGVNLDEKLSDDDVQKMLCHISHLIDIKLDPDFRLVFLFQEVSCSGFIREFSKRQPRMLQFLKDQEEVAIQLDSMEKGAKISSVVGSSVGLIGGVLSIIGLALIPLTAGVSLSLLIGGIACSITSAVNSIVTTATEVGMNCTEQKKVNRIIQKFMEDAQHLHDCLEEVTHQTVKIKTSQAEVALEVSKIGCQIGFAGKSIDTVVDAASALKALKSEQVIVTAGKVVAQEGKALRNVPRVAADIPDIGQAALKGSVAFTKSARAGLIGLNAFFLGMDVFFICKDSISLSKGSETEVSQFIRARAALWRSEIDAWENMHNSLCEGLQTSEKNLAVLFKPFYY